MYLSFSLVQKMANSLLCVYGVVSSEHHPIPVHFSVMYLMWCISGVQHKWLQFNHKISGTKIL